MNEQIDWNYIDKEKWERDFHKDPFFLDCTGTTTKMVVHLPDKLEQQGWTANMYSRPVIGPKHLVVLKDREDNILISSEGETRLAAQSHFALQMFELLANMITFET